MASFPTVILAFYAIFVVSALPNQLYWRDFDGAVPDDAIVAGSRNGETIYIGQVYFTKYGNGMGQVPVELRAGMIDIPIAEATLPISNKNAKILCGSESDYTWRILNNIDPLPAELVGTFIRGGYEQYWGETYEYITRVTTTNGSYIGRTSPDYILDGQGFIVTYLDGRELMHAFENFEILVTP